MKGQKKIHKEVYMMIVSTKIRYEKHKWWML
jgi:hypothetical protein